MKAALREPPCLRIILYRVTLDDRLGNVRQNKLAVLMRGFHAISYLRNNLAALLKKISSRCSSVRSIAIKRSRSVLISHMG